MAIPAGTKFHGVSNLVETENKGSAQVNALRNVYTIEEIIAETASSDAVQLFQRTLTPAEILSFNGGNTLELIAAPGANKAIIVLEHAMYVDFNSVAYDATQGLAMSYGDSNFFGTTLIDNSYLNVTADILVSSYNNGVVNPPFIGTRS